MVQQDPDPAEVARAREAANSLDSLLAQSADLSAADWLLQEGGLAEAAN